MSNLLIYVHYKDAVVKRLQLSKFASDNVAAVVAGLLRVPDVLGAAVVCSAGTIIQELGEEPEYGWLQTVATLPIERSDT